MSHFLLRLGRPRDLHSFPTRRSSDLTRQSRRSERAAADGLHRVGCNCASRWQPGHRQFACAEIGRAHVELQSQSNLVCRLLLEKKTRMSTNTLTLTNLTLS